MTIEEFFKSLEGTTNEVEKAYVKTTSPIGTVAGRFTIKKFLERVFASQGKKMAGIPEISECLLGGDTGEFLVALNDYVESRPVDESEDPFPIKAGGKIEGQEATLNLDLGGRDNQEFFLTSEKEDSIILDMNAERMVKSLSVPFPVAYARARKVFVDYLPRSPNGVFEKRHPTWGKNVQVLNSYSRPLWTRWKEENPEAWANLPLELPHLVERLIHHLFPREDERDYLYVWARAAMRKRANAMLLLCGIPGCGKNRLKYVFQALHGAMNTTDGKESTLKGQFNSQLRDNTLLWFDELRFNLDMSNRLKEAENDTVSIEAKGVDATRSTEIHSSVVISNNYPRHNYLVFEDRKYAPLVLTDTKLEERMSFKEINLMTRKLNERDPKFDVVMVAQIAKFMLFHGKKHAERWPRLEYKGPMFWRLCHTSMKPSWRRAIHVLDSQESKGRRAAAVGYDAENDVFLWSKLVKYVQTLYKEIEFDTPPTCADFFRKFRDMAGKEVFKVFETIPGVAKLEFDDFYIRVPEGKIALGLDKITSDDSGTSAIDLL